MMRLSLALLSLLPPRCLHQSGPATDTAAVSARSCTCSIRIVHAVLLLISEHTLVFTDVSSELEAKLKHELEHTERLDAHFVEYLCSRDMAPTSRSDSAAGSLHHTYELLSPELQVYTWIPYLYYYGLFFFFSFIALYLNAV